MSLFLDTVKYAVREWALDIEEFGALECLISFKKECPTEYNMLLLASLEMQAKELENLKDAN